MYKPRSMVTNEAEPEPNGDEPEDDNDDEEEFR
jgi:hypothetical protein